MSDTARPAAADEVVALELPAPFDDLPPHVAAPIGTWLRAHGIDPSRVCAGRPVERDAHRRSLTFREVFDGEVRRRILVPPIIKGAWPTPFPSAWVDLKSTASASPGGVHLTSAR